MVAMCLKNAGRLVPSRSERFPCMLECRSSQGIGLATVSTDRFKSTMPQSDTANQPAKVQFPELKHVRSFPYIGSVIPQLSGIPGQLRKEAYTLWPKMRKKYGPFYSIGLPSLGNPDCIYQTVHVISDPREMVPVIRSGGSYPSGLVESLWVSRSWNDKNITGAKALLERGKEWKRIRTFFQTDMLHPESARGYVPGMIKAAELASAGAPASQDAINAYLGRCAFDLFSSIMFGELTQVADPTTPTNSENERFATEAALGLGVSIEMLLNPYEVIMHNLGITTKNCEICFAAFDATFGISRAKIDAFCERRERNELTEMEQNSYLARALDRQLDPTSEVSLEEVKEMCSQALFAAIDTTSAVMGWNLFHVARCEDVQKKLYEELKNAVEKDGKDGKLTVDALTRENVPYLYAILRETQRLTPPGPIFVTKQLAQDGVIVYNRPMKKGDVISFEGYTTGMDPDLVDDPEEFNPGRWSAAEAAARKGTPKEIIDHPFLKDPFSQGARKCPGARVASNEMHVLLSQLVLDWKITSPIKSMKDATYHQRTMVEIQMPELQFEARN